MKRANFLAGISVLLLGLTLPAAAEQVVLLKVNQPPPTWSSGQLYNKLAVRVSRER